VRISVVIVTMGGSRLLDRCLVELASGATKPEEVVLVDQSPGASESGMPILAEAGIAFQRISIPPTGVSPARNRGAAAAVGDALAFTDDDCVPGPGWLTALAAAVASDDVAAATGRVLPLDEGVPGLAPVASRTDTRRRVFRDGDAYAPWEIGTGGNLLIERAAFDAVGGFNPEFGPGGRYRTAEDIEFLDRVVASGLSIRYEPDAFVYHEMKAPSGRMARRIPYGFGMGAFISRLPRDRRGRVRRRYAQMQVLAFASALRHLGMRKAAETALMLAGAIAGSIAARRRDSDDGAQASSSR
jgi:GT2 family glycosyltransferase